MDNLPMVYNRQDFKMWYYHEWLKFQFGPEEDEEDGQD